MTVHDFKNEIDWRRYKSFISEMHCLECQAPSLSNSSAPNALSLRRTLYLMIAEGKSDQEIVNFIAEHYSEFTFRRPPLTLSVALMWAAPIILLAVSALLLAFVVRKRLRKTAMKGLVLSEVERNRLAGLLGSTMSKKK